MKLGRLNHVGVATPSIEASIAFYRDVMGAEVIREPFDLPARGCGCASSTRPTARSS